MKVTRTRYLAIAVILFVTTGCQLIAQPPGQPHSVQHDVGEVLIYNAGLNTLVVAVDSSTERKDGFVDQWYVLQTAAPVADTRIHLRIANVSFRDGILRVISHPERSIYELALEGVNVEAPPAPGYTTSRTEGFGLSRNTGQTALRMPTDDGGESLSDDWGEIDGGGMGATLCESGGLGATQCALGVGTKTCSVSCTSPAYACCYKTTTGVRCQCLH
jgi:hypothetical protein